MATEIKNRIERLCREQATLFLKMVVDYQELLAELNHNIEIIAGPLYVSLPRADFDILMNFIKAFEEGPVTPQAIEESYKDIRPSMNRTEVDSYLGLKMSIDVGYLRMQGARDNMTSELEHL